MLSSYSAFNDVALVFNPEVRFIFLSLHLSAQLLSVRHNVIPVCQHNQPPEEVEDAEANDRSVDTLYLRLRDRNGIIIY